MQGIALRRFFEKASSFESVFADNSWEQIIEACHSGNVPDTWLVGDSKAMTINGKDVLIDIIGKNHDRYSDGSGIAPLTFQTHDCYERGIQMYPRLDSGSKNNWGESEIRCTYLPSVLAAMPESVKKGIRTVLKWSTLGDESSEMQATGDSLFLLSEIEVMGYIKYSGEGEGSEYEYYSVGGSSAIRKYINGAANGWWLRSPNISDATKICYVKSAGASDSLTYYTNGPAYTGVAFAFCF